MRYFFGRIFPQHKQPFQYHNTQHPIYQHKNWMNSVVKQTQKR